jgi:UDP-glucose 4-epimerase
MRVVVIGATGNVGTALLRALAHEEAVTEIVGVARRRHGPEDHVGAGRHLAR